MFLLGFLVTLFAAVTTAWRGHSSPLFASKRVINIEVPMGEGFQPAKTKMRPLFEASELYTVEYSVPFDLNVAPEKGFPAPVMTREGTKGELPGDALRAFTCWTKGFASSGAGGAANDLLSFAGVIEWKKSLFDCTGAPWSQVVDALLSNTPDRGTTVTLIFERPLDSPEEASA